MGPETSGSETKSRDVAVQPDDAAIVKAKMTRFGSLNVGGEPVGSHVRVSGPGDSVDCATGYMVGSIDADADGGYRG